MRVGVARCGAHTGGDAGIGPNDASIAAMAEIFNDAVLTENTADFEALGVPTESC